MNFLAQIPLVEAIKIIETRPYSVVGDVGLLSDGRNVILLLLLLLLLARFVERLEEGVRPRLREVVGILELLDGRHGF